jgi:RNA polymerase sigma-70 factor (ECF subfamily)
MDADQHQQFAQRMVRNQQRVFAYIVSLVPNRADAEELFQQTCLTL